MASPPTAAMERRTYRCHSCNIEVSLSRSATITTLLCPHCNSDDPERVLSDNNPNPNYPNPNSSQIPFPFFFDPSIPTATDDSTTNFRFPSVTASDDNFLLDSPYLRRLIDGITDSDSSSSTTTITTNLIYHTPASKAAVEAIPLVKITAAFLENDPIILCAVCKDQFVIDDETKQLPCKHMYHPDCILPWLAQHNSCPVCRFKLPIESVRDEIIARRRSRSRVLRLRGLNEHIDDEAMLGVGFRNLHHQYLQSEVNPEVMLPLPHMGQPVEVDVLPDSGQANGLETASNWPNWRVNGSAVDDGEIGGDAGWIDAIDGALL